MMNKFAELTAVTEAQFQAEQAKLRDILVLEKKLRDEAAMLEQQHAKARETYHADVAGSRVYGGDVLWQGWVSRSRRTLQIELARVLMQKGQMIRVLQRAHGRKLASEEIAQAAGEEHRARREKMQIELEQSLKLADMARKTRL